MDDEAIVKKYGKENLEAAKKLQELRGQGFKVKFYPKPKPTLSKIDTERYAQNAQSSKMPL